MEYEKTECKIEIAKPKMEVEYSISPPSFLNPIHKPDTESSSAKSESAPSEHDMKLP